MTKESIIDFVAFGCSPEMAVALATENKAGIARQICLERGGKSGAKIVARSKKIENAARGGDISSAIKEFNLLAKRANKVSAPKSKLNKELKNSIKIVVKDLRKTICVLKSIEDDRTEKAAVAEAARAAELAQIQEMKRANEAAEEAITEAIVDSVASAAEIGFEEAANILERVEASFIADEKAARKAAKKAAKEAAAAAEFEKQSIIETALAVEYDVSVEDIRTWGKIAEDHKVSLARYLHFRGFVLEASERYGLEARKCWKEFWRAFRFRFNSFTKTLQTFAMFVKNEVKIFSKAVRKAFDKVKNSTKRIIQRINGKVRVFHYPVE